MTTTIDHRLLICSLCDRTFASPRLLPCLHVFCAACIEQYVADIQIKRRSDIQHVFGLTVLPEHNKIGATPGVATSPATHHDDNEPKEDDGFNELSASALDATIPLHSYDDIPAHDASAEFHRRGADKEHHDVDIYEEVAARGPDSNSTPLLREALKQTRSGSLHVDRESFGPKYFAMNKSQSALDNGDLVAMALAGSFSNASYATISSSREALNPTWDSSSERSDSQNHVVTSSNHLFPDVVPKSRTSRKVSDSQSEVTINLQRNNTICGKASLMPGFIDNIGARRDSKGQLLEDMRISKQPSMISVISSSSGYSPGDDTSSVAASSIQLPRKVKDKSKHKRKSGDKTARKDKKERKSKVVAPIMKPVSRPRLDIPTPEVRCASECYHADVSLEDEYVYEMPVSYKDSNPSIPPRRKNSPNIPPLPDNSPPLPPRRGVPNLYTDNDTMTRSSNQEIPIQSPKNMSRLTKTDLSIDDNHYDYVDNSHHHPSKKVTAALLREGTSQYGPALRKSQALLDGEGYQYINDAFPKLKVTTAQGESEFLYKEVHQLEQAIEEQSPKRSRSHSQWSTSSADSLLEHEYECPQCSAVFRFDQGVKRLKNATFILALQDIHFKQCLKPKSCSECDSRNVFKECATCHVNLCQTCDKKHTCSDVKSNEIEPIYGNLQARCMNHSSNVCEYYCHTCCLQICNECYVTSHRHHACALMDVIKSRAETYLGEYQNLSADVKQLYEHEILQMDKYLRQYEVDKEKVLSDITYAYVRARQLMEEAYCELSRHVNFRYEEEMNYVKDLQGSNRRFTDRIEHASCFAKHLASHGHQIDNIEMTRALSDNLLDLQSQQPIKLDTKLHVQFSPSTSKPIDFIPVIGNASRVYNSIRRRNVFPEEMLPRRERMLHEKKPLIQVGVFKPRTDGDARGCKPTGVTISNKGEIVIVDDINRKIKVFSERGLLIYEVNPKGESALIDPWDITMTHYGNFVVTDKGSKSVKIFDTDGEIVSEFGPHLSSPWGVCANTSGDLIVTDTHHKSVFVHDSIGNLKYKVNCPDGLLVFPEYVTSNINNDIIVSDFKGNCIHVFSSVGQFLFRIKSSTVNCKLFESPCGVTCDQQGNILLADFENARVCEFTSGGQFICYVLTKSDHIRGPQCLVSNTKAADQTLKLVLVDGTEIKIYKRTIRGGLPVSQPDEAGDDEANTFDLELKPKSYNKVPEAPRPRRRVLPLSITSHKVDDNDNSRTSSLTLTSPDTYDVPRIPTSTSTESQTGTSSQIKPGHTIEGTASAIEEVDTKHSDTCSITDKSSIDNSPISLPTDEAIATAENPVVGEAKDDDPQHSSAELDLVSKCDNILECDTVNVQQLSKSGIPLPKPRHLPNKKSNQLAGVVANKDEPHEALESLATDFHTTSTSSDKTVVEAQEIQTRSIQAVTKSHSTHFETSKRKYSLPINAAMSDTPSLLHESYRMSALNRSTRHKPLIDKIIKQLRLEEGSSSTPNTSHSTSAISHSRSLSVRTGSGSGPNSIKIPARFKELTEEKSVKRRSVSLTRNRHRVSVRPKLNVSPVSSAAEADDVRTGNKYESSKPDDSETRYGSS